MTTVFLPGWATGSAVWPSWLQPNATECRHWTSTPDINQLERQLTALQAESGAPLTLIGWSLGSMLALELAARQPHSIKELLLFSATPRFTAMAGYPHGLPAAAVTHLAAQVERKPRAALHAFHAGMFTAQEDSAAKAFQRDIAPLLPPPDQAQLLAGLTYLQTADLRPILPHITQPCHILHGTADAICLPAAAAQLAETVPHARLHWLEGAGHMPFFSQGRQCQQILREVLR